jgi:tRNA(fMet)-specific endonuclease VapC
MLDTNTCGYIIRNKPENIKAKFQQIEKAHEITLSSIVVAELLYGAMKKSSPKLTNLIKSFINNFTIHDFDENAAYHYASIRDALVKKGTIIGSNDLFIAAHAKALKATLVTNNLKEFQRVDELFLENWVE